MPAPSKGPRLGGSPSHQRLILANLATSLFTHGRITTTEAKARRLRPYAERLITKAKRGDLHNRREIQKLIRDKNVVHRLMNELGPLFSNREGGYTRITKTLPRKGDNAPMAVIELITTETVTSEADRARRVTASRRGGGSAGANPTPAPAQGREATAEAATAEEGAATDAARGAGTDAGAGDAPVDAPGPAAEAVDEPGPAAEAVDEPGPAAEAVDEPGAAAEAVDGSAAIAEAADEPGSAAKPADEREP